MEEPLVHSQSQWNDEKPLVSVIMPTYDRPQYLQEAIASAVNQTYQNIEIIVSDNCSPESPWSIIESFQDSRIKFFRNDQNLGMFANTMGAFKRATGQYVASLLDDDAWEPQYLERLVPALEKHKDVAIAFCDHYVMDEHSKIDSVKTEACSQTYGRVGLKEGIYQPFWELAIVTQSVSPAIAAVMRRDVIDWETIPAEVGALWDVYLAYLCSAQGYGAYYVPERLTRYREHSQTETMQSGRQNVQSKLTKAKAKIFCYQTFMGDSRLADVHPYCQRQLAHHLTTLGVALMRMNQTKDARPHFWRSLQISPSLRAMAAWVLSFFPNQIAHRF